MGVREIIWTYRKKNKEKAAKLARALGITEITASLLLERGLVEEEEVRKFLSPTLADLSDPFLLDGMRQAVNRIRKALQQGERILIYGDYDCDGVTSTALLYSCLQDMGGQASFYIPSRFEEGYGLSGEALRKAAIEGTNLIITVDCGESAEVEVALAKELGMDIIVTDHHQPQGKTHALAHINPMRQEAGHPAKGLAGVGVAFKLAQALYEGLGGGDGWRHYLDLVALGTVADIVPLKGENRILVTYGLETINKGKRPGFKALIQVAGISQKKIDSGHLGFILAPRINAAGRMGDARPGVELMTTSNASLAMEVAQDLDMENKHRQRVEQDVLEDARALAAKKDLQAQSVLVLASQGWHEGVLGIVASRLLEAFYKPVILLSVDEDGKAKGSGRSRAGFNLVEALSQASPLLERYGGHELAAGLTLKAENIPLLEDRLNELAQSVMGTEEQIGTLTMDARVGGQELTFSLAEELALLAPFGFGNPKPLLGGTFTVLEKRQVGKNGNHLKMRVEEGGQNFPALYFRNGSQGEEPLCFRQANLAFSPEINVWRGRKELSLMVKNLAFADSFSVKNLTVVDNRNFESKGNYLRELAQYGKGTIMVYVNTHHEKEQISRQPGLKDVVFVHQGKGFPQECKEGHLILWSLPMQEDNLVPLLTRWKDEALTVHLLYGKEDYKQNQRLIKASLPDVEVMAELFAALHESRRAPVHIGKMQAYLEKKIPLPLTKHLIERAVLILEETGLLHINETAYTTQVPKFSREGLQESKLFQEDKRRLEACTRFQEYLLTSEIDELLNFFSRG